MSIPPLQRAPNEVRALSAAVDQAERLLADGHLKEAWTVALPLAKTLPLRADVWRILGDITWLGRAQEKSARAYRRALLIDPGAGTSLMGMAQSSHYVTFADRDLWRSAITTLPMAPHQLLEICIEGCAASGRWQTAFAATQRLLDADAEPVDVWGSLVTRFTDAGKWADAVHAARITSVLWPAAPRIQQAVADLKSAMDSWSPVNQDGVSIEHTWAVLRQVAESVSGMARRLGRLSSVSPVEESLEPLAGYISRSVVATANLGAQRVGWDRDKAMADVVRAYRYDIAPEDRKAIVQVLMRHFPDLTSDDLISCPHCGEGNRLGRRNASLISGEARVIFDLDAITEDVAPYLPVESPTPFHLSLIISYVCKVEGVTRDVVECGNCGIVYLNWRYQPSVLNRYHERRDMPMQESDESRYYGAASYYPWVRRKANPITWLRSKIGSFTGMDVLDVGAGDGTMMWFARRLGARVSGVEPSAPSAAFARDVLGLKRARAGYYGPEAYGPASFDLIYSFHALEHFEDIGLFRDGIRRHLRTGGHLMVSVPCVETDDAAVFKDVGNSHFIGLRPAFLVNWLRAGGLEVLDCKVTDGPRKSLDRDREHGGPLWSGIKSDLTVLARKPG